MTNFDFEKRTLASPYTVPDGFFEQMEDTLAMRAASIRYNAPSALCGRGCRGRAGDWDSRSV